MIPAPKLRTGQSTVPQTVPAPMGGLNGRDPLANMSPNDAYLLDNMFPGTAYCESRQGSKKYSSTALGGPVQTLAVYAGGTGDKMLAWAAGKVFDVSVPVAVQLATGNLTNLVITTMFSNSADTSQHLMVATGVDTPYRYDGTAIANLALTGMTGSASTLNYVFAFKSRLYWGQRDKLGFYYLPVGALQGALSYFDLAQVSKLGGYLVAIASFSEQSGNGPNDYIVFITSKGECIVYAGFDPSTAANFGLVGRYYTAPPIGNRCTLNYGSELVIITLDGAIPFSEIRRAGDPNAQANAQASVGALTSKLGSYLSSFNANATVPGWSGTQYAGNSQGGWLILNVPTTGSISGAYYHYIMNTVTNAWCRFKDWNGLCFTVYNRRLYFGRFDGYVMLGDDGRTDEGAAIRVDVKQAYNYFDDGQGLGSIQKHFQWASLLVQCDGTPPISGKFNVDYFEEQPVYVNTLTPTTGSEWDIPFWDQGVWGGDAQTQRFIITLNKGGTAGSLWMRAQLTGLTLRWFATQFTMQKTNGLLI